MCVGACPTVARGFTQTRACTTRACALGDCRRLAALAAAKLQREKDSREAEQKPPRAAWVLGDLVL
jgi:hypothetical protein